MRYDIIKKDVAPEVEWARLVKASNAMADRLRQAIEDGAEREPLLPQPVTLPQIRSRVSYDLHPINDPGTQTFRNIENRAHEITEAIDLATVTADAHETQADELYRHDPSLRPRRLTILDLAADDCRYPTDDSDGVQFFCGAPATYRCYCAKHAAIAYRSRERA